MKRVLILLSGFALLAAVSFIGWVVLAMGPLSDWTGGSAVLAALIVGDALVAGGLAAGLMALAFYSSRTGFDDRVVYGPDEVWRAAPPPRRPGSPPAR
jgi:hypothetical protein